jgi:hypothetical protein
LFLSLITIYYVYYKKLYLAFHNLLFFSFMAVVQACIETLWRQELSCFFLLHPSHIAWIFVGTVVLFLAQMTENRSDCFQKIYLSAQAAITIKPQTMWLKQQRFISYRASRFGSCWGLFSSFADVCLLAVCSHDERELWSLPVLTWAYGLGSHSHDLM